MCVCVSVFACGCVVCSRKCVHVCVCVCVCLSVCLSLCLQQTVALFYRVIVCSAVLKMLHQIKMVFLRGL